MTGLWVALGAIAVALAFGAFRALTDGRFRGTHAVHGLDTPSPSGSGGSTSGEAASASDSAGRAASASDSAGRAASASERVETTAWSQLGDAAASTELGARATLVQFSSAFCAPCRTTRRVLEDVARTTPGVVHVEIDAEHHLDATRRLGILRTPTTLVLDAAGRELARASGAPRKEQVLAAIPDADLA